jgi:hypothetical protein
MTLVFNYTFKFDYKSFETQYLKKNIRNIKCQNQFTGTVLIINLILINFSDRLNPFLNPTICSHPEGDLALLRLGTKQKL